MSRASPVRVFIGSGEASLIERKTLIYSLRKHTRRPLDIYVFNGTHNAIEHDDADPVPAPLSLKVKYQNRTEFSNYRFLIPELCGREGRAIWLDSDMVCLADIGELFDTPLDGCDFLAAPETNLGPGSWALSVMLIDCARCRFDVDLFCRESAQGLYSYTDFHGMRSGFLARHPYRIGALSRSWNMLDRHDAETKIIHYTGLHTQPWKYRGHPYGELWFRYFNEARAAGDISAWDIERSTFRSAVRLDLLQGNAPPRWRAAAVMLTKVGTKLGARLRRRFGAPAAFDEGWAAERAYWGAVLGDFYRTRYGLDLHPSQADLSLVPPLETVVKIQLANKADPEAFFASGYRTVLAYQTELIDHDFPLDRAKNILELGVGVGRLIVHYFPFAANLYGCDVTPEAVAWTRAKLGHRVHVERTGLEPPLPYPDDHFDFVYANSVFTHVPTSLMDPWAGELRRIIRPGGFLIFSMLDANHYLRGHTYREFHRHFEVSGGRDWDHDKGVLRLTYLDRRSLLAIWGKHFRVLELRTHYRDQSHLVCRREA